MKKIILSSIFAVALIATTGYGVNKSMKSDANLSDLALANVEALATPESPVKIPCVHEEDSSCRVLCQDEDGTMYHIDFVNFRES